MPVRQPIEPCTTDLPVVGAGIYWRSPTGRMVVATLPRQQAVMFSRSKIAWLDFCRWLDPAELLARQMIDRAK